MKYQESELSLNLQYLNQLLIDKEHSLEYRQGKKALMIKNALKKRNLSFFINHLKVKLFRSNYYSLSGNYRFQSQECLEEYDSLPRIAVYTCIVGNYDEIMEPLFVNSNVDYFIFTDQSIGSKSKWKKIDITTLKEYSYNNGTILNRKIKILPYNYLENYDYSIYIDGNIQIVADLIPLILKMGDRALGVHTHAIRDCIYKEVSGVELLHKADPQKIFQQIDRYRLEGFPDNYGLFQNSILIRNHNSTSGKELMNLWWKEYSKEFTRDQISLPYAIWKMGLDSSEIFVLGRDVYQNPRFRIINHR